MNKNDIVIIIGICFLCFAIGQIIGFGDGERYGVWWERERIKIKERDSAIEIRQEPQDDIS